MIANGYVAMQRETLSGRALEREVFSRITARLERADPNAPGGHAQLAEALLDNHRLWMTIAIDVAQSENACTPELRAGLLSLAAFVERHTRGVIDKRLSHGVLIEINQNVIKGLSAPNQEAA